MHCIPTVRWTLQWIHQQNANHAGPLPDAATAYWTACRIKQNAQSAAIANFRSPARQPLSTTRPSTGSNAAAWYVDWVVHRIGVESLATWTSARHSSAEPDDWPVIANATQVAHRGFRMRWKRWQTSVDLSFGDAGATRRNLDAWSNHWTQTWTRWAVESNRSDSTSTLDRGFTLTVMAMLGSWHSMASGFDRVRIAVPPPAARANARIAASLLGSMPIDALTGSATEGADVLTDWPPF